jgi:hypothetical protein
MPEDVAQRLEELRVDINTVELPESLDEVNMDLPTVAADLTAAEYNYSGSIAVGDQEYSLQHHPYHYRRRAATGY